MKLMEWKTENMKKTSVRIFERRLTDKNRFVRGEVKRDHAWTGLS